MEERKKEQEEHKRKKAEYERHLLNKVFSKFNFFSKLKLIYIFACYFRTLQKLKDTKQKLAKLENEQKDSADLTTLKKVLQDLEDEEKKIQEREEEMKKKERLTPWNVDTIGQDGFTKTVINTKPPRKDADAGLSDEEKEKRMKQFVKENEKELKEFGMLRKYDDSKKFLQEHPHLVCENTANYLVVWCINLEMEEVSSFATNGILLTVNNYN